MVWYYIFLEGPKGRIPTSVTPTLPLLGEPSTSAKADYFIISYVGIWFIGVLIATLSVAFWPIIATVLHQLQTHFHNPIASRTPGITSDCFWSYRCLFHLRAEHPSCSLGCPHELVDHRTTSASGTSPVTARPFLGSLDLYVYQKSSWPTIYVSCTCFCQSRSARVSVTWAPSVHVPGPSHRFCIKKIGSTRPASS